LVVIDSENPFRIAMSNQPREKYTEITIKPEKIEPEEVKFIE
jgi:hypothetical protein